MQFPVGESRLETMPIELLETVVKFSARGNDFDPYSAKSRDAYKKGVSKLLSLCLVSKSVDAVVRPFIFDNVLICRSTELILLLRTLTENCEMGEYIKKLNLSTTFPRRDADHEFLDVDVLRGLDFDLDLILPDGLVRMTSRQENDLRINLYLKVLEKAPNVNTVKMNPPSWIVRGIEDRQLSSFGIASVMAHKRMAIPRASLSRLPKTAKALTIEGREQNEGLTEGLPVQISGFWRQDSIDESSLEKIIWMFDDTTWFDSLPGSQWASDGSGLRGRFPSLTSLVLAFSACRFSDIAIVCDSFPSLKKLKIVSNYAKHLLNNGKTDEMDGLSPDKTRLCLTRSITKLQHLETLHLDLATVPDDSKLLGDGGGLDISPLTRLSVAELSFRLFVFNKTTTRRGSKYDPSLFLPQSLEKLGIMVRGYKCEAGGDLMRFLKGLQKASKYSFPRLTRVQYKHATGSPGRQTVKPRRICICASNPHEDYCTFDRGSSTIYSFLPWLPSEEVQVLREKFGQRDIKLMKGTATGWVVTDT